MRLLSSTVLLTGCLTNAAQSFIDSRHNVQRGTLHYRNYFYVGGTYIMQNNSTLVHGQMYVEHLTPTKITQPLPILFIEGHGMTGTNLLNTPDGRLGWADYFLSKGYELYLVDQPARARSAWLSGIDGNQSVADVTYIESHFTSTWRYNLWPQARLHTQWPGNGSAGDNTFDQFYKSTHPSLISTQEQSNLIKAAGSELINAIGDVILMVHSQSGQFGWILGDANPSKVKGIVALEPIGPPFSDAIFDTEFARPYGITVIPVTYDPPLETSADLNAVPISSDPANNYTCYHQAEPARKLVNLMKIPILMVTSESSYHAVYDGCTAEYLAQAEVNVEHIRLEEMGIYGNGHMMFMEKNGLHIAEDVIDKWIRKTFGSH